MFPRAPHHRGFTAQLDCRYLLHVPAAITPRTALIVALHGFGATPDAMLRLTASMFGAEHVIAAIEGPNQFYTDTRAEAVGFGWITRHAPASCIRLHHEMVERVLNEAGAECGVPPERRILAGFSQPVSLNYRFVATFPGQARGVAAICGGLPSDWESGAYKPVTASVLHLARDADEFYPPSVTSTYLERLKLRATDVEFHLLEGGHRFPSKGRAPAERWLQRILR
jgi:predicted esterase